MAAFLETSLSRVDLPKHVEQWSFQVPAFDADGLKRDLAMLHDYNGSLEEFLSKLYELFRVYFYQPYVFSFLALEPEVDPRAINVATFDVDARTLDEWAIEQQSSVASYVKTLPKGSLLISPDVRFRTYFRVDPDLADILMMESSDEKFSLLEKKLLKPEQMPQITDFRLIEKNKPEGMGSDCAACSSFVMPVWHDEKLLGLLFYGTDVFQLFSSNNEILNIDDILYLQLVEQFVGLHLNKHLGRSING